MGHSLAGSTIAVQVLRKGIIHGELSPNRRSQKCVLFTYFFTNLLSVSEYIFVEMRRNMEKKKTLNPKPYKNNGTLTKLNLVS